MSQREATVRRRAERLLAIYPATWRARYGEEFVELLIADIEDRPRSWRRSADLAANAVIARLRVAGLTGGTLDPEVQIRASLAAVACTAAAFLTFGIAMWSQVIVGWRWEPPATTSVAVAMVAMCAAAILMVVLAVAAAVPVVWALPRAVIARQGSALRPPCLLMIASAAILALGGRHFENHWPGTGGHRWAYHGLVPSGVAAFGWADTRGVTSYWMHPGALATLGTAEVTWMAISPVAILSLLVGLTKIVRRLELAPRTLIYEANLARAAVAAMVVFAGGASFWVIADGSPGPTGIYQVGAIDFIGLAVMAVTLTGSYQATTQARSAQSALNNTATKRTVTIDHGSG